MRFKDLMELLPELEYQYDGDWDVPCTGVRFSTPRLPPRGTFLVLMDGSWPPSTRLGEPRTQDRRRDERALEQAAARDVTGVICHPRLRGAPGTSGQNVLFSEDTYAVACGIASALRKILKTQHITAVTGSAGKTSVKTMLAHALRACGVGRVTSTPGNQNLYRTVLSLVSRAGQYDHTVVEASSAALLTFRDTEFCISPDVGIITSIGEAHLDYMDSVENIARVKSDIFQHPPAGGTAVINLDTDCADLLIRHAVAEGCQMVTYGESAEATIQLIEWDPILRRAVAMVGQERIEYTLGSDGKHTAINSLAVIAALRAHRIKNWRTGVHSLAEWQAPEGRGQISHAQLPAGGSVTLIDEAYNSNPLSVRSSVASLQHRSVPAASRRIAVLGDIGELGSQAENVHRGLADTIAAAEIDHVLLFGEHMRHLYQAVLPHTDNVSHWPSLESLREDLLDLLRDGDVVLMKASLSMGLQQLVKEMTAATE